MNKQEWWAMVDANWPEILVFCENNLPMEEHQDAEGNDSEKTVRQHVLEAFRKKDHVLACFLNDAWFRSPENEDTPIHGVLNFLFEEEPLWEEIDFDD